MSRPVMCLMSVSDTTLARNKSQQNTQQSEYKVIKESITGPGMGPGPAWLTLTLLLKYLAQCETINYV